MKTIAIIQARTGSTRLPGKVLLDVGGKTVLERVVQRVRAARGVEEVIVATTTERDDDRIATWCAVHGVACHRGSADDVLDRFHQAARAKSPDRIVRITADCPLMDPAVIDLVIAAHEQSRADYAANTIEPTFPDGLDVEVLSFGALERAWREARLASEREHVTPYLWKNPGLFSLHSVKNTEDLSGKRWTLDEPEDYRFIREVYRILADAGDIFGMDTVLAMLREHPQVERINARFRRNDGYEKSVRDDTAIPGGHAA